MAPCVDALLRDMKKVKNKDKKSHFTKVSSPQGIKLEREKIKEFYCKKRIVDKRKSGKMERKFILIKTDMSISTLEIEDSKLFDTAYELCDCSCIEIVNILIRNCLIIDNSGKLKDKKVNPLCSLLYAGWVVDDYIVGDALLGKRVGPDIIGLNEKELKEMLGYLEYLKKEVQDVKHWCILLCSH